MLYRNERVNYMGGSDTPEPVLRMLANYTVTEDYVVPNVTNTGDSEDGTPAPFDRVHVNIPDNFVILGVSAHLVHDYDRDVVRGLDTYYYSTAYFIRPVPYAEGANVSTVEIHVTVSMAQLLTVS